MDIAIILALALVALAAALLAWAWRRNRPPCATCRHQYKRYEWSNGRTAYSCRLVLVVKLPELHADVGIMLDQMAIEFKVEDAVAEQRANKVRRLRERIEKDD